MGKTTRYLGLDVHAETITAAIAEGRMKVRNLGQFPNRPEAIKKFIEKLGNRKTLQVCYEAGPTGYALYWQLTKLGVECEVVAPSLIPKKSGDRIKNDRRDAEKLAECYQAGTLTSVWVPDGAHEALRDLVRARGAAKDDESRAKHRLVKYLLHYAVRDPEVRISPIVNNHFATSGSLDSVIGIGAKGRGQVEVSGGLSNLGPVGNSG
jgi:transposase